MASVERRSSGHQRFSGLSMPREISQTPSISRLGSTVFTAHLQKCYVEQEMDGDHPLEQMKVVFTEDDLHLTTTGLLGKGGFGKVFVAESASGEVYALKVSSKKMTEADWKRLNEEVTLMSHFSRHPNIVKFFTAGRDEDRAYVVMERCASRSLHDVIAYRSLETPEILWIGWALIDTISYIHSKGCIHRDLKPQNLLFDFEGNLKITDFGLSSRISETQPRKTVAGTAMYMAPEMAEEVYKRMTKTGETPSLSYGQEVDAWSIGVVLYVMLTRMNPYLDALESSGMNNLSKEQKSLALFNSVANAKWSWPKNWKGDSRLCGIVERLLHADPDERCSLQQILEDPVWNDRPLSCPLSLRQKLNLLEPSPVSAPLSKIAENIVPSKKPIANLIEEAINRVEATERRARTCIMLEYQETFTILFNAISLARAESAERKSIIEKEEAARQQIYNKRVMQANKKARGGSMAIVAEVDAENATKSRRSVSRRSSVSLLEGGSDDGLLVRSSPDQYAVAYPGRESSTRWSLRPVISLPREFTAEIEQEFRCMNNHVMTKLTSMPYGYNGFDCNVCDRGILRITADAPAFRCYKCDYDVCMKCAFSKRFKDVKIVCVSCGKKFTTAAKLQAHSLQCRGPSCSPSPRSSSRMNTMLWEESKRPSLLEVQLPEGTPRKSTRQSTGRPTYIRTSVGGRISIGDTKVPSPEDMRGKVVEHKDASFPSLPKQRRSTKGRRSTPSSDSFSFKLPPEVELPKKRNSKEVIQPRSSAEFQNPVKQPEKFIDHLASAPADPPRYNESGEIIGIAARKRAASVDVAESRGFVTIRAQTAEKPEVPKFSAQKKPEAPEKRPRQEDVVSIPLRRDQQPVARGSEQRAVSLNGMSAPLPRHGPGAPLPRSNFPTAAAVPPRNFMMRPSQYSMPNPMAAGRSVTPARAHPLTNTGGAFLALPKENENKQQFLNEFLSGGWVRFYSFSNEDTVVMYYTLQPGRYGAMFPTEAGVGTAVLDVHSKLVLYVPCMNNESTSRSQPHPHVQTFYDEEARILTIAEAKRYLGAVLQCITSFVMEISRLKAEGLTPAAVHAAYIHQPHISSVPRDAKFVYIRKVFPDPSGTFTLFRLSNLRSQVICNAMLDIRWQSDRRHNVGQKYYVNPDGTAEPFVVDQTGILSQVEVVLNNSYRR